MESNKLSDNKTLAEKNNIKSENCYIPYILGLIILIALFITSRYNFLIFHTLAEFLSIAVAWSVFILVWHTKRFIQRDAFIFLGISYFFIGSIDLVHTLSYKGMGVIDVNLGANPATQLWIAARYMESMSLCLFSVLLSKHIKPNCVFAVFSVATTLILFSIFYWDIFPIC